MKPLARLFAAALLAAGALLPLAGSLAQSTDRMPAGISTEDAAAIRRKRNTLAQSLTELGQHLAVPQRLSDAELFLKGVDWALRYEDSLSPADAALIRRGLDRGTERAQSLKAGKTPWAEKKGRLVRAYVSQVDGSTQPYGLIVPEGYNPEKPIRLDVVLHGSSHPTGLSELRFLAPFDEGDTGAAGPQQNWIELHPLGRVENCYRWAGETDVFEAIDDVRRCYNIDRERIVLRGMSMGASGTWHLGLKHPDQFAALGPYCGYVDTHLFSVTPGMGFVKVGPLPEYQERALHMLDSVDYAANAGMVPVVAAIGDRDPFFQAHVIMGRAMEREGLHLTNLISPGTGHVQDPATHAEELRQMQPFVERGIDHTPRNLRFVTWTLKYSRCNWLEALGLGEHYRRAELRAEADSGGSVRLDEPVNITRLAIYPPMLTSPGAKLTIGRKEVQLPHDRPHDGLVIARRGDHWAYVGGRKDTHLQGKQPGIQGPIDDAFVRPFLCVRGTGKPWNLAVGAWADANLKRFTYEWNRYFRGECPVKDDTEVTGQDLRRCNLILFGDPGSNLWIRKALSKLPIRWTRDELQMGGERYAAAEHGPVLIQPNPLPGGEGRYLVLNSGHTFHEQELNTLNYLLFPRLGDWAVMKVGTGSGVVETPLRAGFFDERWRFAPELCWSTPAGSTAARQ